MEINNEKKQQQDFVTNKLLIVFTMVFAGIFAAMYLFRTANSSSDGYMLSVVLSNIFFYVSLVGTILCGVKCFLDKDKEVLQPYKLITAKHLCSIFAVTFICFAFAKTFSILVAVKYIYILLTAIAVQYFVLVSYSKDIYLTAMTNIINLVLVYFIGISTNNAIFYAAVSIIFLVATFVFIKKVQASNGSIKGYSVFKKGTNYQALVVNVAILACITALSTVLAIAGYSIGVIIGGIYLIVIIFYNTLKIL